MIHNSRDDHSETMISDRTKNTRKNQRQLEVEDLENEIENNDDEDQDNEEEENDKPSDEKDPLEGDDFNQQNAKQKSTMQMNQFSLQGISLMQVKKAIDNQQQQQQKVQQIQQEIVVYGKTLIVAEKSLNIFDINSELRVKIIWIVESVYFEWFIILTIILSTILMMFTDYEWRLTNSNDTTTISQIQRYSEYIISTIFFLEFLLKLIAFGFVLEKNTYLRSGWNVIDFLVVISSVISLSGGDNLRAARTIRIVRPLRSINAIKGIKTLVESLIAALPALGNVVIFLTYLILLFAILGIQLFQGNLENRCRFYEKPKGNIWKANPNITRLCLENDDSTCPTGYFCRNPSSHGIPIQKGEEFIPQLNYGYSTFDDIFWAILTVFQVITLEGWSKIVNIYQYAVNPAVVYIYFTSITLLGSFFALNLIIAVINDTYLNATNQRLKDQQEEQKKAKEEKKREKESKRIRNNSSKVVPLNDETGGTQISVQKPRENVIGTVQEESDDSDDSTKKREKELFSIALKPVYYLGRAQILKRLEEQHNRQTKEKVDFFDPVLTTVNKNDEGAKHYSILQVLKEKINKLRRFTVENLIETCLFNFFITVIIVANTICLSLDRYPQPQDEVHSLQTANLIFTLIFLFEMVIKLFAYGFHNYFKDSLNIFDSFIVCISLVEQILESFQQKVSGGMFTAITAFRTLRLFRIFKLARSWTSFRKLLIAIIDTLSQIGFFLILLMLVKPFIYYKFVIVASLLGMELFAYNARFTSYDALNIASNKLKGESPMLNFDNFFNALIVVFAIITGDNWFEIAWTYMIGMDAWWPSLYFCVVIIIGNFILLRLFLVILLYNFGQTAAENKKKEEESQKRIGFAQVLENMKQKNANLAPLKQEEKKKKIKKPIEEYLGENQNSDAACFFQGKYDQERFEKRRERKQKKLVQRFFDTADIEDPDDISDDSEQSRIEKQKEEKELEANRLKEKLMQINKGRESLKERRSIFELEMSAKNREEEKKKKKLKLIEGTSLYIFSTKSKVRKVVIRLINHSLFEAFIIVMILLSSIMLALDDPLVEEQNQVFQIIDLMITVIFIIEAALKILANGLIINGENSYLRQLGNIVDFMVIIFSVLSFQSKSNTFSKVKIIRTMRVLRPIRLISRNSGLRVALNSLVNAIPNILNLLLVCFIFYLLFGIFGTSSLKGTFFYCDTTNMPLKLHRLIWTEADCYDYGGSWVNQIFNFDDIPHATVSLFIVSTTEGWIDLMFLGSNSRGIGLNPRLNSKIYWQLFYVGFVIVGAFFVVNLFVGVVVDQFNQEKEKIRGIFYLSLEQQDWLEIQYRIVASKPKKVHKISKTSKVKRFFFKLTQNKYFESAIQVLIVLNTVMFMIQKLRQPQVVTDMLTYSNIIFLTLFSLEVLCEMIALGKHYFDDGLHIFDLVIVLLSVAGYILEQLNIFSQIGAGASVLRSFRVIRILKLVEGWATLQLMFETFFTTIPELLNIIILLMIVIFMYSVIGMNLFPYLKRPETGGISYLSNFTTFQSACWTLFKIATGEDWHLILRDSVRFNDANYVCYSQSSTSDYDTYGFMGCGNWTGYVYLISFQLIFSMVMLKLLIAVIIVGYDNSIRTKNSRIQPVHFKQFQEAWKIFDKDATGFIQANHFTQMMLMLQKPLGWKGTFISASEMRLAHSKLAIPAYILKKNKQGMYFYYDVLKAICNAYLKTLFGEVIPLEPEQPVKAHRTLVKLRQKILDKIQGVSFSKFTSSEVVACLILKNRLQRMVELRKQMEAEYGSREENSQDQDEDHRPLPPRIPMRRINGDSESQSDSDSDSQTTPI